MAPTWLAALAVLLLLGGAAAQPSFTFPTIPNLIAGQTSDTKDLLVTLNNPVPNPPGPTFFPVTLTATLNNNLITMTPTQVTFNAAGSWQGVFTIAASSTAPPSFSPSFLAMTNITWTVDDTVHYAPPASFNVSVVPNTVDICVLNNCYPGGAGVPVIQIFPGFQSSTITFSTQYPPVNGLTYTLAATPTNGISFSPSATLSQGPGANVASFTVTTSTFPASGALTVVIGGPDVAFFAAYPTPPAGTMSYATTTIPIEVTPTPTTTAVTILAGTSYTFTVNLAYPLPSGVSSVTLTPSLSGSGLSFSPTALVYSGTTTSQVLTVTANRVLTSGVYTVSWTQNPSAAAGPYSAVPNLLISVPQRQIQFIWPGSISSPNNKIFIGESFPLEIRLPTYPSGTITVSLAAPQTGGPALISFNPTSVTFSSTNNVTAAIITGTPNSFPLTSGFEYPNTFSVNIQVTIAGSDFALYAQPGTQTIVVSRRQFYVPNQTPASMTLTMGLPSPPITVTAPLASTLSQLAGTVTLTPIVNSNPSLVFIPPFLSFSSTSQATQTVTVLLNEQADRGVTQAVSPIAVNWVLGGSVADLAYFSRVQPIANFPTFTWNPTPIRLWQNGAVNQASGSLGTTVALVAGESTSITMTVEFLPLTSITVTVNCPEVSITSFGSAPSSTNTGTFTFTAGGSRTITFTIQALALSPNGRTMTFELSGPDAVFYARPADVTVNVAARTVTLSAPAAIQIGDISNDFFFTVPQLPINGITLTPMSGNNPVGPTDAVRFIPGSVSFGAGSAYVQTFSVVGSVLGTFTYTFVISGPDAAWYNFATPASAVVTVSVGMRQAPAIDLPTSPNSGIIPGMPVGPFTAKLSIAPDADLTISPTAPDWTFVPASLTFAAGQRFASFIGTWNPVNINSRTETGQTEIFYRVTGTDSWKYNYLAPTLYTANTITKRSFVITTPQPMIFGTTHHGSIAINTDSSTVTPRDVTVTPSSTGITFNPATWTMTATTRTVYFTYTTNVNPGVISNSPLNTNSVLINFVLSGSDANLFQVPGDLTLTVAQRSFVYDLNYQNSFTNNQASATQFVVGKTYPLFSVATAQPLSGASSVTLTPTCRFAVFSPASATFTPTSSVASFTWTPTAVPPLGGQVRVDWILSGPDALVYTIGNLPTNTFTIVPPLVFSNPPLIPVDGTGVVTIALAPGYTPTEPFSVHISDDVASPGIVHSPSIFHFQTGAVNSTQSFTIQHLRPSIFGNAPSGLNGYTLNYGIRYTGANGVVSNLIYYNAPLNAVAVRVSRYDIVPDFPFTIGYRFCPAAINLTRAPLADLTLIPDLLVNSNNGRLDGSRKEPAGRIIFDTPVIFFPAGQNYAAFNVRVDRRIDEEALYYRIDWTINAHPEDAATYLPFRSTWHMGAGSVASVTSFLLLATLLLLLL